MCPSPSKTHLLTALLAAITPGACRSTPSTVLDLPPDAILDRLREQGSAADVTLDDGRVRYLGFEAEPRQAAAGDAVRITHYWVATRPLERDLRVFVHALVQGASGWVPHGDHDPSPATSAWPQGRVIRDEHVMELPERLPGDEVELRVGLYRGDARLPVDAPRHHDGTERILAGSFRALGQPVPLPRYEARKLAAPVTLDGRVEEAEWGGAPWIDGFTRSRGDAPSGLRTRARLAWTDDSLFLAMETEDPDIQATLRGRDAPVYREEALEIFLDPGASGRDYVELQVSPLGTLFDAAFRAGPRQNMDRGYDADYEVAVAVRGTVGEPSDVDQGWSTEWRIGLRSLRGAKLPVASGAVWRMNLFRIAKDRRAGRQEADESAWSPPLMGDFHNLRRFGELVFAGQRGEP